jgi:hypothetical protein
MSQPTIGITPEVIRQIMPPYQPSPDLLDATLAALPAPPREATTTWRHAHIARPTREISVLMPANAAQVLISREFADTRYPDLLSQPAAKCDPPPPPPEWRIPQAWPPIPDITTLPRVFFSPRGRGEKIFCLGP